MFNKKDERIPAHRLILSSRNYFRALLSGHLLENQNEEICLKDVRATPFKALLKFIYNGYLVLSDMEMDEIIDILRLAQMYGFIDRTDSIESHLEHAISMETVWPILKVSQDLIIDSLSEACFKFLDRNASTVLLHDQLPTLSKESLCALLKRVTFAAPEEEIFAAVQNWSHQRDSSLTLDLVRFPAIQLLGLVSRSGLLSKNQLSNVMSEEQNKTEKLLLEHHSRTQ